MATTLGEPLHKINVNVLTVTMHEEQITYKGVQDGGVSASLHEFFSRCLLALLGYSIAGTAIHTHCNNTKYNVVSTRRWHALDGTSGCPLLEWPTARFIYSSMFLMSQVLFVILNRKRRIIVNMKNCPGKLLQICSHPFRQWSILTVEIQGSPFQSQNNMTGTINYAFQPPSWTWRNLRTSLGQSNLVELVLYVVHAGGVLYSPIQSNSYGSASTLAILGRVLDSPILFKNSESSHWTSVSLV